MEVREKTERPCASREAVTPRSRAERRAHAGAQLLDKTWPHWASSISMTKLNLNDEEACILGQLCGRWNSGCLRLGIATSRGSRKYGFGPYVFPAAYERAWATEVAARVR